MIVNYEVEKIWKEEFVTFVFNDWRKGTATLRRNSGTEAGTQSSSWIQIRNAIVWDRLLGVISEIYYRAAQCSSIDRETAKIKPLQI